MKVPKFYKFATWTLLALNVAILAFFFFLPPPPPHQGPRGGRNSEFLEKNALNLEKDQESLFMESAEKHQDLIITVNKEQAEALALYFGNLHTDGSEAQKDSLLRVIKNLEGKKVETTYEHFEEVKEILNEDQKANFKDFVDKLLNRSIVRNGGRGRKR